MRESLPTASAGQAGVQDLTGTTVGRFRVRARLGAGGMGEVYLARDFKLDLNFALKKPSARAGRQTSDRNFEEEHQPGYRICSNTGHSSAAPCRERPSLCRIPGGRGVPTVKTKRTQ